MWKLRREGSNACAIIRPMTDKTSGMGISKHQGSIFRSWNLLFLASPNPKPTPLSQPTCVSISQRSRVIKALNLLHTGTVQRHGSSKHLHDEFSHAQAIRDGRGRNSWAVANGRPNNRPALSPQDPPSNTISAPDWARDLPLS
jgi:hypothetical protein